MNKPKLFETNCSDHHEMRLLAGSCYLALRTGDPKFLRSITYNDALSTSELCGTFANLCSKHGITISHEAAIEGLQQTATNLHRWNSLIALVERLKEDGIEPVVFKGGAIHARWPELREFRALFDYDLIVPQNEVIQLRAWLAKDGFESAPTTSWATRRLSKGWMVWKGHGLNYQNLDIHARVTEAPVCSSLTTSILKSTCSSGEVRIPCIEDCVCMIALHIVRSGMYRPLREYIDLLWYTDEMNEIEWESLLAKAREHHLTPALYLALRQAHYCLALEELAPERADRLQARISKLRSAVDPCRRWLLEFLAPADYPLHPISSRNHPVFRRSMILGAGTSSLWRVATAFTMYGTSRFIDRISGLDSPSE